MVAKKKVAKKVTKKAATKKLIKKVLRKKTYVGIVLDRSGSMSSIRDETVKGLNEQLAVLRRDGGKGGDTEVTLVQFDDKREIVFNDTPSDKLVDWKNDQFVPRGMTAMYDAVWTTINLLKEKDDTGNVGFLVCVLSDGEENASKDVSQQTLSDEIKRLQNTGKWTFTFMLANQDIHKVSNNLNVPIGNMSSFTANSAGMNRASAVSGQSLNSYMSMRSVGQTYSTDFYDNSQDTQVTPAPTKSVKKTPKIKA